MTVTYRVTPASPHEHLFEVEARFKSEGSLELWMPVWTPGSYLVREYARHVQDFAATDGTGTPLPWRRADKCTWRVEKPADGTIVVRYRVYAHELTVRTSHLDGSHGYFNGANLFVTSDLHRGVPCEMAIGLPAGWKAFCALPSARGAFQARDFDELIDSPVEMGPLDAFGFTAAGRPHEVVVWGEGNLDRATMAEDLRKICEVEAGMFGALPFERYLFILLLTDKGRGGLEHIASCSLVATRHHFRPRKNYEDFLALAAHEYFHLWNVKRIKPKAFVPFDYKRESYTSLLWAMEGITSYYDTLILRRAGIIDAARYLVKLGETLTSVMATPGRKLLPLAEASRLAWIKHYRPDENTPNTAISYYTKGEIVAALLDLELRRRTGGKKSLDDVMRLLFRRHGDGSGVPEDGVEQAAAEIAGGDLSAFFDRAIRTGDDPDFGIFEAAGLTLRRRGKKNAADKGGTPGDGEGDKPWLGVDLKGGDRLVVATTYADSPAARAGLYPDDEILAVDGCRVTSSSLTERIEERPPGSTARLTIFRRDQLLEVPVAIENRPATACWLEKSANPTPEQRALYEEWLGEKF